jgi:hypothetical protein
VAGPLGTLGSGFLCDLCVHCGESHSLPGEDRKDLTQSSQSIAENHREIGLSLSVVYSSSSGLASQCPLWLFSVFSVLNPEKRKQKCAPYDYFDGW